MTDNKTTGSGPEQANPIAARKSNIPPKRRLVHLAALGIIIFLVAAKFMNFVVPLFFGIYFPEPFKEFCNGWWPAYLFLIAIFAWGFTRP